MVRIGLEENEENEENDSLATQLQAVFSAYDPLRRRDRGEPVNGMGRDGKGGWLPWTYRTSSYYRDRQRRPPFGNKRGLLV